MLSATLNKTLPSFLPYRWVKRQTRDWKIWLPSSQPAGRDNLDGTPLGSQGQNARAVISPICRSDSEDQTTQYTLYRRKEGHVLFNDALNTFYLRLYGVRHMVKDHSDSEKGRKEGNVLFNDALNTFYLRLYVVRHMVKDHSDSEKGRKEGRKCFI